MCGRLVRPGTATVLVLAAATTALSAQDFEWSEPMSAGELLEVEGITGDIRAELATGGTATVVARKEGRSADFDDVEIRVVRHSDGYTVCAVYRPRRPGEDTCDNDGDRDGDHDRNRSIDVSVDFIVQVPAGVDFDGTMVTGDVEAEGLRSDVHASSVTGDVVVSTTGTVRASTVSGSLDIEMGRLERSQKFNTVSGDITLRLPPDLDADVEFESVSGELDSDYDLTITRGGERRWVGSDLRATIGEGGPQLSFNTVSGDVRLRRSGRAVR